MYIGISTGSFELRGDGKFHEWTIFNQYPAGAAKIQVIDDVFLGVRTATDDVSAAVVLQTHPTDTRLPVVESLQYQGMFDHRVQFVKQVVYVCTSVFLPENFIR